MSKLCDAIKNLPSRFLSEELVMEAAKEHEPKLLGYLPEEFITPEVVEEVFGGGLNAYYWNCDLSRVPVECRTRDVCMKALRCSSENMFHVPSYLIDDQIVEVVLQSSKKLQYFHLLPSHLWTKGFIYRAMKSLGANHSNSSYSSGNVKSDVIRRCRVLLSLAPDSIKTGSFYLGLFEEKMASAVISALTPVKYQNKQYRRLMAHYDINCVPVKELTYELVVIALGKGAGVSSHGLFKPTERREHIFEMMDNRLADTIVAAYPTFFNELPEQFQSSTRLQLAVKSAGEDEENRYYHLRHCEELLTPNVVREFVKQGIECKIPATFWDEEFSWFCAQHTRSFFWFEQMPRELQTKEMVSAAIRRCHSNLRYASKDKITENVACEVVRGVVNAPSYSSTRENMEYLPEKYFAKFTKKTGLPEKFMGAILAGEFTEGALSQLKSLGFQVLYFPYKTVVAAFAKCGIDASFDEETEEEDFRCKIESWENSPYKNEIVRNLFMINKASVDEFLSALRASVTRKIEQVIILPLHGNTLRTATIAEAIDLVSGYEEDNPCVCPVDRYEILIRYNTGDKIEASFREKKDAILFLQNYL